MGFGQRLKLAMQRRDVTQKELASRTGMRRGAVNLILNEKRNPTIDTAERMVAAAGVPWSELYNEPQILLTPQDAAVLRNSIPILGRILENDTAQKGIGAPSTPPPRARRRRRRKASEASTLPRGSKIEDSDPIHHEVLPVPNGFVPEWALRAGATRPYHVHTDSMIGAGILDDAEIYVRSSRDENAADDRIIVCTLNRSTYLKRLDLRGGEKVLASANPRYSAITVTDDDTFAMIGVVELPPEEE